MSENNGSVEEVFLISVGNEMEFDIVESKLKEAGIPVIKNYKEMGEYLTVFMGKTPFGIDIFVPADCLETAMQIISIGEEDESLESEKEFEEMGEEFIEEEESNVDHDKNKKLGIWTVILLFGSGVLLMVIAAIIALFK